MHIQKTTFRILTLSLPFILFSCSHEPSALSLDQSRAYIGSTSPISKTFETSTGEKIQFEEGDEELFNEYAPVFVIENDHKNYNKIGEPKIRRIVQGKLEAYVDPSSSVMFAGKRQFFTESGTYTNLIYRVHFEKTPYSLTPFYLTAGKNIGIFAIVTLNDRKQPILFTMVNTCGCFISVVPTNYLQKSAFPKNWKPSPKFRYGERLTEMLYYSKPFDSSDRPTVYVRHASHRISDVFIQKLDVTKKQFDTVETNLFPIKRLDYLPIDGEKEEASFFYTGLNKGYVRDTYKPFEFLFISWWAFDMNVGVDKKYASSKELSMRFYTSLNPAYREQSDMWNFQRFLKFWGWNL